MDVADPVLMGARSWRWLRLRIVGLASADTRIARALAPEPPTVPGKPRR